jgi:uncharacterized protein involved in exopolysaccharide biosynthesis/Mrp family chromosome partitioning ATPase
MSQSKPATPPPSLSLQDILYVVFKHKWKILVCSAAGLAAAAAVYLSSPPVYESQAKLLVRYVVDTSAIDQVDSRSGTGPASESLINSEVEILTSWDLATEVATVVGVDRFLPARTRWDDWLGRTQSPPTLANAARTIRSGLSVSSLSKTNIIVVSFKSYDPELTTQVLKELVTRYFTKHLEVHRSAEAFNFVSQQSDELRSRLSLTEDELKRLKGEVGITSLTVSTSNLDERLAKTQAEFQDATARLAEQRAAVQELEKAFAAVEEKKFSKPSEANEKAQAVIQYHSILDRLGQLREIQLRLFSKYLEKQDLATPETLKGTRQVVKSSETRNRVPEMVFIGHERTDAQTLARERYRRQNDTGFAYQGNKKDFDTLVKEAEKEILGLRGTPAHEAKQFESEVVKVNQAQIESLEKQRIELEKKFPGIAESQPPTLGQNLQSELRERVITATVSEIVGGMANQVRLDIERARLAGLEAKTETLKSTFSDFQKQMQVLTDLGPRIAQLERTKEIEEKNYKYFQESLEKARVDEALDPSKIPNISVVQSPSAAFNASRQTKKVVLGLAAGGIALGLAFAFLMELVINASVKRRSQLEALLGLPVVLSIPYLNGRSSRRLQWPFAAGTEKLRLGNGASWTVAPWDSEHFIRPYTEALRDRLVLHFELNGMNHKPKLVALSDCSAGAGASTLAGGLAAALSETGDGKVLLVDMNVGHPEVHPFLGGTPACSLSEALVGEPTPAGDNLYLAVATAPESRQAPLIPKKFYDLMPHLKASDFDYIIFDLPPLGQTSVALPMARFMDKILVIVEAERSNQDFIKRAYSELIASRASVSVIFNKARSYAPRWLGAET